MQSEPHDALIGGHLDGRYRITGVLGHGGMGIVYEGVHEELGRAVAIKVLGPHTANDAVVVERFVREARLASGLAHGNIVEVSDLGRLPDGRPYLVMPKVDGVDFATLLERQGQMAPVRVMSLLRGVAAALDLVHAKGLVHRDVKPENLMYVVRADGSENVLLMDFGIAALLAGDAARLTAEGMRCGTPAYMAPESIATGEFDQRADVYALATVAFEMLTGRLPFDAVLPMIVMDQKTRCAAPSLSTVAPDMQFDVELERVVARGLERDPNLRFPSCGEFVASLEHAVLTDAAAPSVVDAHTLVLPAPASVAPEPAATPIPSAEREAGTSSVAGRSTSGARRAVLVSPSSLPLIGLSKVSGLVAAVLVVATLVLVRHRAPLSPPPRRVTRSIAMQPAQVAPPSAAQPTADAPPPPARNLASQATSSPRVAHRQAPAVPAPAHDEQPPASQRANMVQDAPASASNASATDSDRTTLERAADRELVQGHLARAVELFERAIVEDAADVAAFRGLGLAQERLGHSTAAVRAYRSALALEPEGVHSARLRERLQRLGARD